MDLPSEFKGIMDPNTQTLKSHLVCFHTEVPILVVFTQNNMEEFLDYELAGGGGTDFDCVYNLDERRRYPTQEVGYVYRWLPWDSWGDESYCDALFIVHGGGLRRTFLATIICHNCPYTREESGLQG